MRTDNPFSETAALTAVIVGVVLGVGFFALYLLRPMVLDFLGPFLRLGQ